MEHLAVRVLLTVGHRFDASRLGPTPRNVRVEAWVEQAEVLRSAQLAVCHGGSGTAFGALAAGVPVLVMPLFADQFENGRRIVEAGAGLVVVPTPPGVASSRQVFAPDDAVRLTEGIMTILARTSYTDQARAIAGEIGSAPSVDAVLDTLLADVMN
jgi:UDP:flavonoid glycosyltransferase YjiC (YdhE family)